MATQICGNCFKGTEYTYSKPKFCSHCGSDMVKIFASAASPTSVQRYESVAPEIPKYANLIRVLSDNDDKGVSIRDVVEGRVQVPLRGPESRNADQVMQDFKKKASTGGPPIEE